MADYETLIVETPQSAPGVALIRLNRPEALNALNSQLLGELAQALATGPRALGYIRKLVWDGLDAEWAEQLQAERIVQREAGRTEDSREGVLAFLQKRPAQFQWR